MTEQTYTCKCGYTVTKIPHDPIVRALTSESLNYLAKIECAGCGARVCIDTIQEQGMGLWFTMPMTGRVFCAGCSHQLGFDNI